MANISSTGDYFKMKRDDQAAKKPWSRRNLKGQIYESYDKLMAGEFGDFTPELEARARENAFDTVDQEIAAMMQDVQATRAALGGTYSGHTAGALDRVRMMGATQKAGIATQLALEFAAKRNEGRMAGLSGKHAMLTGAENAHLQRKQTDAAEDAAMMSAFGSLAGAGTRLAVGLQPAPVVPTKKKPADSPYWGEA